ncbi:hypothetical protein [Salibacterium halotolerans]|uniref:Uncharacterized protein n=1 Tax=Salibacterium halotolerans TaxID=1884432 RepID=A0A1I5L902_9BACI|nr:hypothetical protein [Salibacterium halotolerans]SFO93727.1 hypothetical protein SAMN05518683_101150 [Salibacterium halotolerans]
MNILLWSLHTSLSNHHLFFKRLQGHALLGFLINIEQEGTVPFLVSPNLAVTIKLVSEQKKKRTDDSLAAVLLGRQASTVP